VVLQELGVLTRLPVQCQTQPSDDFPYTHERIEPFSPPNNSSIEASRIFFSLSSTKNPCTKKGQSTRSPFFQIHLNKNAVHLEI
jgi:hypothetical protein